MVWHRSRARTPTPWGVVWAARERPDEREGVGVRKLSDLEVGILHGERHGGLLAYAVWVNREGEMDMGPVRSRRERSLREQDRGASRYGYSCSPFPGGWAEVDETRIVRVRDLGALSLEGMRCVCRGTEWDSHCPGEDCTTPVRGQA
jgi:hypothetical protein